jgi:hypothetical protein
LEYWPTGQVTQEIDPVAGWYLPPEQSTQSPRVFAPVEERYVPAGHEKHVLVPEGAYFPAGHCKHDT